ncbi:hypothetical protein [Chitinophaga sp. GbtcB8]|uniref:hypothetical protein n=1 Tax=Chitinophaga sp. GbtcB8 TaxID=2824753 RepID=UPI001C30E38D|nr:hypothetical protein [Chitinophaga sp. GbtcB8]
MKRGFLLFAIINAVFFAIVLPMLLYYNIKSEYPPNLRERDPWFALSVAAASVVIWGVVLAGYFRKWIINIFIAKRNITYLREKGIRREAKIMAVTKTSKPNAGYDAYDLNLSFKNLVGAEILQKASINDAKPYERRFEVGKKIELLLDKEVKHEPYFIFATSEATIKKAAIALISFGWLALTALVIAYYGYAYLSESEGMGWRFMSLGHPLIVCPAILLFFRIIITLIYHKLAKPGDAVSIKFKGIQTDARLLKASQTGTYINEQPQVKFDLEYTDHLKKTHHASLKKIVGLLELDTLKQEHISIYYLKEKPEKIAFASDLNELS